MNSQDRISTIVVRFVLGLKRTGRWLTFIVAHQYFNPAFGLIQTILAFTRKGDSLLKQFEAAFQRQLALLQLAHDAFEFLQRRFESFWFRGAHRLKMGLRLSLSANNLRYKALSPKDRKIIQLTL